MRNNKIQKYSMNKLDKSYENTKYHYKKKNINNNNNISKNIFSTSKKLNNNCTAFQNIDNKKIFLNKKKNTNNEINNYIFNNKNKLNIIRIQNFNNNNKNKSLKYENGKIERDCLTPDRNINKLNIGLMTHKKDNKNNVFLLKSNIKRNTSFIEYHFKNSSKKYLTRRKSKNNNLIKDRKKALTPDKMNKARNMKFNKNQIKNNKYGENKKIKQSINFNKNLIFSKSFNNNINNETSFNKNKDNNYLYNNYSTNNNIYKNNINYNRSKLPVLTNISKEKDKLSRSFCFQNNSNNRKNNSFIQRNDSFLLSNWKLNITKKELNKIYIQNYSKNNSRANSTDSNYNKKNYRNTPIKNNSIRKTSKNNENSRLIINKSHENINKGYHKTYNNNFINNQLINNNNVHNNFNLSQNIYNNNNKIKRNVNSLKNSNLSKKINNLDYNKTNLNTKTFLEIAQQKISQKKTLNQKNYKYNNGPNNFVTKSSTNTNDDINNSNSIISKNNQLLDSVEEIHFNFVNVEQSSRNLMKLMENIEGEIIVNNNPNSTVIIIEERDIE